MRDFLPYERKYWSIKSIKQLLPINHQKTADPCAISTLSAKHYSKNNIWWRVM